MAESSYSRGAPSAAAEVIDTRYYSATLVPELGGRLVSLIDKASGLDLLADAGYGGLFDDHGARITSPYRLEWLKRDRHEAVARLTLDADVIYQKTIHFYADRPAIQVEYHVENHSQSPNRMLFRNVVRPGGGPFTGEELYCFARVAGLQRARGMPRVDDPSDPWCALVHPSSRRIVATAFEGDVLRRLYTWTASAVAPTYEFMFPQLDPGQQIDLRSWWIFGRGLSAVDYAHRNFLAQIEGAWSGDSLDARLDLLATWGPIEDLTISARLLDGDRRPVSGIEAVKVSLQDLDRVVSVPQRVSGAAGKLAILLLTLEAPELPEPVVIEKAFGLEPGRELPAQARRPIRWLGAAVESRPIEGWRPAAKVAAVPTHADRRRGWLVFEEIGERAGENVREIALDVMQREPEAVALHFHPLSATGQVTVSAAAPPGMSVETFVPEMVPEQLWGRTVHGWKLLPGTSFATRPGEDRPLFFRLTTADVPPGKHEVRLTFHPETGETAEVVIRVHVRPIRFPRHPAMVFDVNNYVQYLCAKDAGRGPMEWDAQRADGYLGDMARHGVAGQSLAGRYSLLDKASYEHVKIRSSGLPLPEAIRRDPAAFRGRAELPGLDFSAWDPFVDRLLAHGMTHVRFPLGNCGDSFSLGQRELTEQIYGRQLPPGDIRQQAVMEWYTGEVVRYLTDRGLPRVFATIDDEIPAEKLAWWVQHAHRASQMGFEPGVTQSAALLADDERLGMVAPFMKYWIVGSLNRGVLEQRRGEGIVRSEHWTTTYVSSACHWVGYDALRLACGLTPAFFGLDACWIQVYYRGKQGEAVIYPGPTGPISSASWEGARDGLDDGNILLVARAMVAALPPAERSAWAERIEQVVGMRDDSLIRFVDGPSHVGVPTTALAAGRSRGAPGAQAERVRLAKTSLLDIVEELSSRVPVQKASANLGLRPIVRDGKACFRVPEGMPWADRACRFLAAAGGDLGMDPVRAEPVSPQDPGPVFFFGTFAQLQELLPGLAGQPGLEDLGASWPQRGSYVVRFVPQPGKLPPSGKSGLVGHPVPESMLIVCGDEAGGTVAEANLINVVTPAKGTYSHWLTRHAGRPVKE